MEEKVRSNALLPLISIGVPVHNESRFLAETLRSLLSQDFDNIEIIISDNASTDGTEQICHHFSGQDKRLRYYRFDVNQGAATNFKRVVELAQGKYFMWAAGHDLWSPNLISECVRLLESNPDAVISFGSSQWVGVSGQPIDKASGWTDTRAMDKVSRFFSVFWGNMHPIYGLIRLEALRRARLLPCAGMDLILLCELVLMGHFVHASSAIWSRREFRQIESHQVRMNRYRSSEYGLSRSPLDRVFPLARLPLELGKVVLRSESSWFEKLSILGILVPSFPVKYIIGRRRRPVRGSDQNPNASM